MSARATPADGVGYGLAAYALWGVVPLFWPLVARAGALEMLAHRVIWSLVISVVLLLTVGAATGAGGAAASATGATC